MTSFFKAFTIIYLLLGFGLFVAFITKVAEQRRHPKNDKSND